MTLLRPQIETLKRLQSREVLGTVSAVKGLAVYVEDLSVPIGSLVRLQPRRATAEVLRGEVIGFDEGRSIVMLFGSAQGIAPGTTVVSEQSAQTVPVSTACRRSWSDSRCSSIMRVYRVSVRRISRLSPSMMR